MSLLAGWPWWQQQLIGIGAVGLWLAGLAFAAIQLRARTTAAPSGTASGVAAASTREWSRKLVHIGTGAVVPIAYGASITLLLCRFWPQHSDAVCAGVLVMAVGDGLAGVIGSWVRSPSWVLFGHRKSLVGTAVMASSALLVLLLLAQISPLLGADSAPPLGGLVAIALIATSLEQLAWLGIDNLSVPIVSGWLWASWR